VGEGLGRASQALGQSARPVDKDDSRSKLCILVKRILARPATFLYGAVSAAFVGGMGWNGACRLFGWSYHLGGPGNWPHGAAAFVWGWLTLFPILPLALWAYYVYGRLTGEAIWRWKWLVLAYALAGGASAVVFYDSGIREFVTSLGYGEVPRELVIVVVWSSIISIFESLSTMACFYLLPRSRDALYALFQTAFSVLFSILAVIVFSVFLPPTVPMLRGLIAGFALRVALFCGLIAFLSRFLQHSRQVFFSYARGGKKNVVVESLCDQLQNEGFQVWLDTRHISLGCPFAAMITAAMRGSAVVLIFLSQLTSLGGFQLTEILLALEIYHNQPRGSFRIIPVRMDDSPVPLELSRLQWLDLREPDAYGRLRDELLVLVGKSH